MKIDDWLLLHYKKKFGNDLVVLDHATGATWNDGGTWNTTIAKVGEEIIQIHMPSNYQCDRLEVKKMEVVMTPSYMPKRF